MTNYPSRFIPANPKPKPTQSRRLRTDFNPPVEIRKPTAAMIVSKVVWSALIVGLLATAACIVHSEINHGTTPFDLNHNSIDLNLD